MGGRFSDWKTDYTPDRAVVGVCLDRRLLSDLTEAEKELADAGAESEKKSKAAGSASLGDNSKTQELQKRVDDLLEKVKDKTRTFVFESIGRRAWSDLLAEHPPTPEQKQEFGDALDHDPETFMPKAMAASCADPDLTEDDAKWLLENLPVGTWNRLVAGCLAVNVIGSRDPFGNGFAAAPVSVQR